MNQVSDPVPQEVRQRLVEAADAMGKHVDTCPVCSKDKYRAMTTMACPALRGLVLELSEAAKQMNPEWFRWVENLLPRVLPAGWKEIERTYHGAVYQAADLRVFVSGDWYADGKRCLHVSVSVNGQRRVPSWDEMQCIKDLFIGREKAAYQVFPAESRKVNLGEVLHLWNCVDGDPLPDFTRGSGAV